MSRYIVEVQAFLNATYTVEVEAEDEELALIEARSEIFGVIDPEDIEITPVEAMETI